MVEHGISANEMAAAESGDGFVSIPEAVTAEICTVFHSTPNPLSRHHCNQGTRAASAALRVVAERIAEEVAATDRGFVSADDPETTRWMEGWDECRTHVLTLLSVTLEGSHG